jgi:hypothetical protein
MSAGSAPVGVAPAWPTLLGNRGGTSLVGVGGGQLCTSVEPTYGGARTWAASSMEDLSLKHEGPKRAYWPTTHARDPAMKARMMCKTENVLLSEGGREVEAETGWSLVEDGRRDCCSSVSGSSLYESLPVSTSAWDSLIFAVGGGGDDGGLEQRLHYMRKFSKISALIWRKIVHKYTSCTSLSQTVCKKHVKMRRRGHKPRIAQSWRKALAENVKDG